MMKTCETCKGTKISVSEAFTYHDELTGKDTHYARRERACYSCEGKGEFPAPDIAALMAAVKGRGERLRSARPKAEGTIFANRAYYVWRMARFHGGADVTMPICASLAVHGDPFHAELDQIADHAAAKYFGTNLAAAHRWGRALGHVARDLPGLPATAYGNGPVLTGEGEKPDEELPELF